jgi:non-homologous end joining protein Ku
MNEKTELQGLAELGIKDFKTLEEVRFRQTDMLDCLASSELASHIVKTKAGHFEPSKFEDQYEDALKELLKKKQEGKPIERPERPKPTNVVNLMDALRRSVAAGGAPTSSKPKPHTPTRRGGNEKAEQPKRKKTRRTG